jgi:ribose-phosphate pyrophosphokinase
VETVEPTTVTELATLPGLETVPAMARDLEPRTDHWIERGPQKRLMLFSGRSHLDLAQKIGERLGVELGEVKIGSFANGETYCRFEESIRGADVFLVQTGCEPVDRNLMELLIMIQAAKLASAKRITAVMPWYPYARQDRKARPREPITARLVADMIQTAGADRVLTMDLHAGQIQGFFSIPVDHMVALPLFAQHLRDQGLVGQGVVSVAPDAGRAKLAVKFAELLEADFAIMHKTRPGHDQAAVTEVTGNVRGKVAIVGDDVIMTGGTLLAGARALREAGATKVYVCATHGVFAKDSLERFRDAEEIDEVLVTDTIPLDPTARPSNMTVLTVSGLLAETIMNVFADESVSAIFQGENQLF